MLHYKYSRIQQIWINFFYRFKTILRKNKTIYTRYQTQTLYKNINKKNL